MLKRNVSWLNYWALTAAILAIGLGIEYFPVPEDAVSVPTRKPAAEVRHIQQSETVLPIPVVPIMDEIVPQPKPTLHRRKKHKTYTTYKTKPFSEFTEHELANLDAVSTDEEKINRIFHPIP